jgi:hypothetical protein
MDFVERIFHISPDGSPLPLITKIEPCASGEKKPRLLAAFATVLTTGAVAPTMSSPNTIRRGSASPLSGWITAYDDDATARMVRKLDLFESALVRHSGP